jgi:hypothetical protein
MGSGWQISGFLLWAAADQHPGWGLPSRYWTAAGRLVLSVANVDPMPPEPQERVQRT